MVDEQRTHHQRGFTLLEMMVVVAIIAILAGILIPNFTRARAQAQTAACIGNLKTIATALELYYTDKQAYPTATSTSIESSFMANIMTGYLSVLPRDPAAPPNTYYMLTTVSAAANGGVAGYTIWCPGSHDPSTLQNIAPGTTNTHLRYDNKSGFAASASQGSGSILRQPPCGRSRKKAHGLCHWLSSRALSPASALALLPDLLRSRL